MRKFFLLFFLFPSMLWAQKSYQTVFRLTENPISESGNWTVPGSTAPQWGNVQTNGTIAYGVILPTTFGDPSANLTGTWGPNQVVTVKVSVTSTPQTCCHEVEMRVRQTISSANINGYEILCPVAQNPGYGIQIVRWNGPNGSYKQLTPTFGGGTYQCVNNDVLMAMVTGTNPTTINVYLNGSLAQTASDDGSAGGGFGAFGPWTSGAPGIGFFDSADSNWNVFGFSSFSATDQSWSSVLSTNRAVDWSNAGLPTPTLLDGESTANHWTPPTRTQCVTAQATTAGTPRGSGLDDSANIMAAVGSCAAGTFVLLNGNYTIGSSLRLFGTNISGHNNVTVRGTGPMNTLLTMGSTGVTIQIGAFQDAGGGNVTNLASNPKSQTSFIVANVTGTSSLTTNNVAYFMQSDNGYTCTAPIGASNTCTGASSDTGGIFWCQHDAYCNDSSHIGGGQHHTEEQEVRIVSATNNGDGTWTVVTDPGLYMSDWASARSATLRWNNVTNSSYGMALEDMSVKLIDNGGSGDNVQIQSGIGNWIKGLRIIGANNSAQIINHGCFRCLVSNNYMFGQSNTYMASALVNGYYSGEDGETLVLNNIGQQTMFNDDNLDQHQNIVLAYNVGRDVDTDHYQATQFEHEAGSAFMLREGNQFGRINDDATWSSHNFNTSFRNNLDCGDYPYQISGGTGGGIQVSSFARFSNLIGNAIGVGIPSSYLTTGSTKCTTYQIQANDGAAYAVNGHTPTDNFFGTTGSTSLTNASLLRWGNVTTNGTTNTVGWNTSENPTNLSNYPNSANYNNLPSPPQSLPCSFFMQASLPSGIAPTATTCVPTSTGSTGLSWWKVCDTWSVFPTSCSHYTTPKFPSAGPDVSGYASDIPATVAWKTLPIDTSYQNSYTITASSWSGGTETLTISGLPALFSLLSGFRLSGVSTNNCFPGATPQELLMTASTAGTVSYALVSNPGSNACTGTMLYPDVRQFDERVYTLDSGSTPQAATPTFDHATNSYPTPQTVGISDTTSSAAICYTTDGSTPTEVSNACSGGTTQTYSTAIAVNTTKTIKALATLSGYTDSAVGSVTITINIPAPAANLFAGVLRASGLVKIVN